MPARGGASSRAEPREVDPAGCGIDLGALAPFLEATGPLAVVDFETTGLPAEPRAEPIEVGLVLLDPGRLRVAGSLVRPRGRVPRAVTALTGLRDADLDDAPPIDALAPALLGALAGRTWVAHNADFERHFLARFVSPVFARSTGLDSQDLLALCHPDAPDLRLATFTASLLGREERHRALDDALDLARVLSHVAVAARSGDPRYAAALAALETYGPREAWVALLRGPGLPGPPASASQPQFIPVPPTAEKRVPFDADAIAAALGDAERGRRHFPRYRVREEQIRMAREFVRLLDEGGRLILEGGTGVGKSLAYLAAVIPFAVERQEGGVREPVVVSTRTKLLQDQLLGKDIPAAAAMLGYPELRALSIKGRANYLCRRRCEQVLAEGRQETIEPRDRLSFAVLAACARLRPHGEVGTLPGALLSRFPPLRDLRRRAVAARAEHCTREQCAAEPRCAFGRRRSALARAHLVVANHDLLLRWPPDYPSFRHVVVDEAHELVGVADEAYAEEVRPEDLAERLGELFGGGPRRAPPLLRPTHAAAVAGFRGDVLADLRALGAALAHRASEFGEVQLPPRAARILPGAAAAAEAGAGRLELAARTAEELEARRGEEDAVSEAVGRAVGDLHAAAEALRAAFGEDDAVVAAFEGLAEPFDRWRLALRQVSPAASFHGQLADKLEALATVSASLFVDGDPAAALGELELEQGAVPSWRFTAPSPFPYAEHMRVIALAERGDPVALTSAVLADVARALGGRTLGLFTSLRRMRDVRDRIAERLRDDGIDVWMPRRATDDPGALVERFRRSGGGGVLLGSRTFWQGIDVPGRALEAVVIEKLPFEVPTELRRRREARVREHGGDPFELYTLGKMLLNLKQMVGRLVRSEEDRGVVVIVDPRSDRPYFERLSAALPAGVEVELLSRAELRSAVRELAATGSEASA